ncbi:tetratricopeptide repeat protein [Trichocoleus sp. FACHB-90]|uniref:tetratricopeptide repeat protein n=1 Tax=Cyanophyceae TaxID=3028117 RepID=UPI0016871DF5|nr:tetratricopeptide repeat protein [Trichocoleus sp. FACHB-90]
MTVTDTAHRKISLVNRQIYQRLKQALSLGLRRQIFIAVCDDISLRNRLAARLHAELAISEDSRGKAGGINSVFRPPASREYPRLVSLNLNLSQPHPVAQINRWLGQHPPPSNNPPGFQILGVELLTKQSAKVQGFFLNSLKTIERSLPNLESSLLLWMPRPWLRAIETSAPEFWRWHTGVFEFEGEPAPASDLRTLMATSLQEFPRQTVPQEETAVPQENLWHILGSELDKFSLAHQENPPSQKEDFKKEPGTPVTSGEGEEEKAPFILNPADAVQSLQEIEQLQQSRPPEELAQAYLRLGNYYRDRIEQSNTSQENLITAIQAYDQALAWLEESSPLAADILNDLGNLYWMLSRYAADSQEMLAYLEQGINAYHTALTKFNPDDAPHSYAMIQNNLGAAYGDLARHQDTAQNLQNSILAYGEALRYRSAEDEPLKYAATQNNLGTAYWHLAQQQQPVTHLKCAIASYTEALPFYNPERDSLNWAMLQNNIGTAYWNLAQYEQPEEFLQLAIAAYQSALTYRTPQSAPAGCAATQNNLGTAYWHLATQVEVNPEGQQQYLQMCIAAYESAIALVEFLSNNNPPVPVTFDVSATQNNLGLAHYQMGTDKKFSLEKTSQLEHLEAALHYHLQALQGFSDQPDSYESALSLVVQTIRAFYRERGLQGQNLALSKVPGKLLPELLRRL